jgi:Zn-dependent protease
MIVVLHELGHALAARRYGCQTRDILLLPIGGVARLEKMPERPREELVVAIAGPAVNLVLAAIFYAAALATDTPLIGEIGPSGEMSSMPVLAQMFWINVALGTFNMVPAFPMDGGRALRALLALKYSRVRATRIASELGQGLAVLLGLLGLAVNPMLVLIAAVVWFGAAAERGHTELEASLGDARVGQAMLTEFQALGQGATIADAVEQILAGFQEDFPVLEADSVIGVLEREAVVKALSEVGPHTSILEYVNREAKVEDVATRLIEALETMQEHAQGTLPVLHQGRLVGLLTRAQFAEYVMITEANRARAEARPASQLPFSRMA